MNFQLRRLGLVGLVGLVAVLSLRAQVTVVGDLVDCTDSPAGTAPVFRPVPGWTPLAWGNKTVLSAERPSSMDTNYHFTARLLGGWYDADFGAWSRKIRIVVPPNDTNTYQFNYLAGLATNLMTFGWTNLLGQISGRVLPGANMVFTTNNAGLANETITVALVAGLPTTNGLNVFTGNNVFANSLEVDGTLTINASTALMTTGAVIFAGTSRFAAPPTLLTTNDVPAGMTWGVTLPANYIVITNSAGVRLGIPGFVIP